jgi:hypothetical protein
MAPTGSHLQYLQFKTKLDLCACSAMLPLRLLGGMQSMMFPYSKHCTTEAGVCRNNTKPYSFASFCCEVKEAITKELPSKFTLVYDGWTEHEDAHHYISVAAAYLKAIDGKEVPTQTMLSMEPLPMLVEGMQGMAGMPARDHLDHIEKVLESYGMAIGNVVCLVANKSSVTQSMVRILNIPLIGCASHKFNLAVQQWITEQAQLTPILQKVCQLTCCCNLQPFLLSCPRLSTLTTYSLSLFINTLLLSVLLLLLPVGAPRHEESTRFETSPPPRSCIN